MQKVQRHSVRALILSPQQDSLCLIRREKKGQLYYVAPGGGVEPEENPIQALRREIHEETGLVVSRIEHRGLVRFAETCQAYFSAQAESLDLAAQGPESHSLWQLENGLFQPEWIPWRALYHLPFVSPEVLQRLITFGATRSWSERPFLFEEKTRQTVDLPRTPAPRRVG